MADDDYGTSRLCREPVFGVNILSQPQPISPTDQSRKFRAAYEIGFLLLYVGYKLLCTFKCLGISSARCFCKSVGNDYRFQTSLDRFLQH